MTILLLQVLGNSDVDYDGNKGSEELEGNSKEEFLNNIYKHIKLNKIDFPLIKKINNDLSNSEIDILFCFILTDQSEWLKDHTKINFKPIAKKDGIYWEDLLKDWCKKQKINCHTIQFLVNPNTDNGVADWENMAQDIEKLLNNYIEFSEDSIGFKSTNNNENERLNLLPVPIDKIIIQHSSGTPALSSSLYLWGIERKIEGRNIEFVYVSEQDEDEDEDENNCEIHSGSHWQWRLKVPQIQELLKIQDFSGAIQLVKTHQEYQQLEDILNLLKELDHAVSFNLSDRPFSEPKDAVVERIAIALWSETAFRERGQWMHWYLRVAGAFELAILCLLENQGNKPNNTQFGWEYETIDTSESAKDSGQDGTFQKSIELKFKNGRRATDTIGKKIPPILDSFTTNKLYEYTIEPVENHNRWLQFKNFYNERKKNSGGEFIFDENKKFWLGFAEIRHKMYHKLMGDIVDSLLDKITKDKSVNNLQHPSQIAINHLEYIIEISNLKDKVKNQVNTYKQKVKNLQKLLK